MNRKNFIFLSLLALPETSIFADQNIKKLNKRLSRRRQKKLLLIKTTIISIKIIIRTKIISTIKKNKNEISIL